jgi:hypothetical protein
MEAPQYLTDLLVSNIHQAQNETIYEELLFQDPMEPFGKNNFLFFIKPEITLPSQTIQLEKILDIVLEKIAAFGFRIHDIRILSAKYLETYNLIEQHYGVIAQIANQGRSQLSTVARERFQEVFNVSPDEVNVLGGNEFLAEYPFFDFHSLDCLWQNAENIKLASGTYAEKLRIDQDTIYLLNAFNPKQLRHFTEKGRSIVTFNLSGDIPWNEARALFAGATNPLKAAEGSLRRTFLDRKEELGLPEVSQSFNGIHLSAGPVEALIELHRFDSDHSRPNGESNYLDFPFGRLLATAFGTIPDVILQNASIEVDGKPVSIFDLTEDKDSDEAFGLLIHALQQ